MKKESESEGEKYFNVRDIVCEIPSIRGGRAKK